VARKQIVQLGSSRRPRSPGRSGRPSTDRAGGSGAARRPASPGRGPKTDRAGSAQRQRQPPLVVAEADADGRIPCGRCGRKFAPDRIAQHQWICGRLRRGPAAPPAVVASRAREMSAAAHHSLPTNRCQGGAARARSGGGRVAAVGPGGRAATSQQRQLPKWREQSKALQEAVRAARRQFGSGASGGARAGAGHNGGGSSCRGAGAASNRPALASRSIARPATPTLAQRKHAAESQRLQEALAASPLRSQRPSTMRSQVDGSVIRGGGGGGFPGMSAMMARGGVGAGGAAACGGVDMTSNLTSPDNPFYVPRGRR
jgi:hypothetical protein